MPSESSGIVRVDLPAWLAPKPLYLIFPFPEAVATSPPFLGTQLYFWLVLAGCRPCVGPRRPLQGWGVPAAGLPPSFCRLRGEGLVQSLACCWPHPGGTIFTHLNALSPKAPGSRPGH